jgi:hypothetical protein
MRKLAFLCVAFSLVAVSFYGCDETPMDPRSVADDTPAFRAHGQPKIRVCHRTEGAVDYMLLTVAEAALAAHLAHGDGVIGDPVPGLPGMVFDDNCLPTPAIRILFDNGSSSGPQDNYGNTVGQQELFEDFTLTETSVITTINWQQHDYNGSTYLYTEVVIFSGLPFDAPPVFSSTIVADRTPNATGTLFDHWDGFDYAIEGLSITLPPGTYWLGLNAEFDGVRSGWDMTLGGPNTIPGFRLVNASFPAPGEELGANLAFTLFGYSQ